MQMIKWNICLLFVGRRARIQLAYRRTEGLQERGRRRNRVRIQYNLKLSLVCGSLYRTESLDSLSPNMSCSTFHNLRRDHHWSRGTFGLWTCGWCPWSICFLFPSRLSRLGLIWYRLILAFDQDPTTQSCSWISSMFASFLLVGSGPSNLV